jgi:sugar phosphate isomerase/epimerase
MTLIRPGVGMINQWLDRDRSAYFLNRLHRGGASFVEFKVSPERWAGREWQIFLALEQGLDVTFHASFAAQYNLALFDPEEKNDVRRLFSELFSRVAFVAEKKKSPALVNVHPAWGDRDADREVLFTKTARFIKWALSLFDKNGWNIRLALELLPRDPRKVKVGEGTGDLVTLRDMLPGLDFTFCWDLGHFHLNRMSGCGDDVPQDRFLEGVGHVHVHDICGDEDHNPLVCGTVPVSGYLSCLDGFSTEGGKTLNAALEIKYENAARLGDPFDMLFLSLALLNKHLEPDDAPPGRPS